MSVGTLDLSRYVAVLTETGRLPPSGEGDFIAADFPVVVEELATMADGQVARIVRKFGGLTFTITVGKHSEAHRLLGVKWAAQKVLMGTNQAIPGESFRCFDPTSGDVFSAQSVVIAQPPSLAANESATLTWVLHGTDIDADFGALIPIGGGSV